MDIAEIRRKAKAGNPSSSEVPREISVPTEEQAPELIAPDVVVGETADPGDTFVIESSPVSAPTQGLARLFAGSGADETRFATEETYQTTLASRDAREDTGFLRFLAFQLGPEEYALDITQISEIIKPRDYTDIPRVPDFVLGLISLRGVVVPVFDLRRRFNLGCVDAGPEARIIVCREGEVVVGLLVDSIKQVINLAAEKLEPPPAVLSGVDRSLISGVGRFQGRMVILLNLAGVLAMEPA